MPWPGWPARTPARRWPLSRSATWAARWPAPVPDGGAQPSIDANYLLIAAGITPAPDLAAAVRAQAQAVKDALAPWHAGYDYYNSEETPAPASAVLPAASHRRLQKITAAHDPGQVIISAHPVSQNEVPRPARPSAPSGSP